MQKYLPTIIVIFGLAAAISADTIRATVNGVVCGFCATGIEKTFRAQPEVKTIDVDLENRLVTIQTKQGRTHFLFLCGLVHDWLLLRLPAFSNHLNPAYVNELRCKASFFRRATSSDQPGM